MSDDDLKCIREINAHLPFAHPIAEYVSPLRLWWLNADGTDFDPTRPTIADLDRAIEIKGVAQIEPRFTAHVLGEWRDE